MDVQKWETGRVLCGLSFFLYAQSFSPEVFPAYCATVQVIPNQQACFREFTLKGITHWYGECKCMCKFSRRTHGTEHFVPHWSMISVTSRRRLHSQTHPSLHPLPSPTLALHRFKTGMDSAERTGSLVDKHAQRKVIHCSRKHTRAQQRQKYTQTS